MMRCTDENAAEPYQEDKHNMFWWNDICEDLNGYTVRLFGMSSAFNCDGNDWDAIESAEKHKIFLPQLAFHGADNKEGRINIMMAHHPTNYLVNGENIQEYLDKHYKIQFFGHVHQAKSNCENDCVHVFSGALQPDGPVKTQGPYRPVFNMIEIDVEKKDATKDLLKVNLQVHVWNGKSFQIDEEESKPYVIELKHNRWKGGLGFMQTATLPDGITKRDIRRRMIEKPSAKSIINKMKPGFYDENIPPYYNITRFMDEINKENKWVELWKEIK
jgi:predicted phosphodiesterase